MYKIIFITYEGIHFFKCNMYKNENYEFNLLYTYKVQCFIKNGRKCISSNNFFQSS